VTCNIGSLGFGSSATVAILTKVVAAGDAIDTATVSNSDQPDGNGSNQSATATTAVAAPPPPVAPPVYGQTANVDVVSGTVLIRLPGTSDFVPLSGLTSIPEGTELDTTKGRVALTSASDPANDTQTSEFYDGRFVFSYEQPKVGSVAPLPGTPTTLVTQLVLSQPLTCPTKKKKTRTLAAPAKQRSLWGSGKGNFRTRGRYAAATVRGTVWFTQDTCTTTTVRVTEGTVDVFDFVLNRHFLVPAGSSHTAKKKP
jgi:hypothetical protein